MNVNAEKERAFITLSLTPIYHTSHSYPSHPTDDHYTRTRYGLFQNTEKFTANMGRFDQTLLLVVFEYTTTVSVAA